MGDDGDGNGDAGLTAERREARVRAAFEDQAGWCDRLGSPYTARLMRALPRLLDLSTATGRRVLGWPGADPGARGDSVPLRLAGALNAAVRAGDAPRLAALAPPHPPAADAAFAEALRDTIEARDASLAAFLDLPPQTNEVGRSGVLFPGLIVVARAAGLPLSLLELGASAGLNLQPDRYVFRLGGRRVGASASPLHLAPDWEGPAPDGPEPVIVARAGCDLSPVDPTSPAGRGRLLAYVWPDQTARVERLEAALAIAAAAPPAVARADAAAWLAARLADAAPGVARVVMHSITFQYFAEPVKAAVTATIEAAGARADATSPLAWLAFEMIDGVATLTLRLWRGDATDGRVRTLATADAHGSRIVWHG